MMAMAHEEYSQRCSNSSSSSDDRGVEGRGLGRSSKRLKQKRVPQRGLGVAQLEKIRLQEQHKKDATLLEATILSPYSTVSPSNSSTGLQKQQLPCILSPTFSPHLSSSSIPLPPQIDLSSRRSALGATLSPRILKINALHSNPVLPLSKSLNVGRGERSWLGIMVPGRGHDHWPKLWNGNDNLEEENQGLDHIGVAFRPNVKLPIEPHTPILPLPSMLQRSERYEQPVSSSTVNVSTAISSSSSSVLKFLMEPPSNQNYKGNNETPLLPEEVKMVGNKRACPFSSDYPPIPVFHCKFPPGYDPSISRTNELVSCCTDFSANVESQNLPTREFPSSLKALSESNPRSFTNGSGGFSGDFLTLAPPSASLPHLDSRYHLRSRNSRPLNLETSSQGGGEELIQPSRPSGSDQPHIFSFFPPPNVQTGQEVSPKNSYEGESSEGVDLNLKL